MPPHPPAILRSMKRSALNGQLALLLPLLLAFALPAGAQTERRYDAQGRAAGRAETQDATTRFYDAQGHGTGRAETHNGVTRFYDAQGRSAGRGESRDGAMRFYDAQGRSAGRSETSSVPRAYAATSCSWAQVMRSHPVPAARGAAPAARSGCAT